MRLAFSLFLCATVFGAASVPSFAQQHLNVVGDFAGQGNGYYSFGDRTPTPPVVHPHLPPQPQFPLQPQPQPTPTPPRFTPPPVVTNPNPGFVGPQPIDVTNQANMAKQELPMQPQALTGNAIDGLNVASDFPKDKDFKGSGEWILVRGETNSEFTRPNEYTAKLEAGTILVSVRRPSHYALVQTPVGDLALHADGDVMLTWSGHTLRIENLSALGGDCKVKLSPSLFGGDKSKTVTLRTGFELVASSTRKLTRADLRPADGIARRRMQLTADGHIGVSEISVQSVLQGSALIAQIHNQNDSKETRVLAQMSKMAAVLNYVNSPYGYTTESRSGEGLASTGTTH